MNASAFVDQARLMASALENNEVMASGPRKAARDRAARFAGLPTSILYSLRYRAPKTIAADVYEKLYAAVERQTEAQIGKLEHEILSIRARRERLDDHALGEAETALAHARSLLKRNG